MRSSSPVANGGSRRTPRRTAPATRMRNARGFADRFLGGICGPLCDPCGRPEPPRSDADEAPEVMAELAPVREAGAGGDLRQGKVSPCLQGLLGPLDAAGDGVPVRRAPRGRLGIGGG